MTIHEAEAAVLARIVARRDGLIDGWGDPRPATPILDILVAVARGDVDVVAAPAIMAAHSLVVAIWLMGGDRPSLPMLQLREAALKLFFDVTRLSLSPGMES